MFNPSFFLSNSNGSSFFINGESNGTTILSNNQTALLMIQRNNVLWDTLSIIKVITTDSLTSGNNPDSQKFKDPNQDYSLPYFTQVSDIWDFRLYAASSGGGFTSFIDSSGQKKLVTIVLPFNTGQLAKVVSSNYLKTHLKIIALNKLTNRWVILPNSVVNPVQGTIAVNTDTLTIYGVIFIN